MISVRQTLLLLSLAIGVASCTSFRDCSDVDVSATATLPELLSQTGLYADIETQSFAVDSIEFTPRFPLWTDGTDKRRWLRLPAGAQIDTQDVEDWVFPTNTRFFKEFAREGVLLETRMTEKTGEGWAAVTYVWNADATEATRQIESVPDVGGTTHDVPSAGECLACHAGRRNFTLGFSATQLGLDTRTSMFEAGLLSAPVTTDLGIEDPARAALGVLHGNCSHCHNSTRDDQTSATECYRPGEDADMDLSLPSDLSDLSEAPAMISARHQLGGPGGSDVLHRMSQRNTSESSPSMPPLGTEVVDDSGLAAVEAFILTLPDTER